MRRALLLSLLALLLSVTGVRGASVTLLAAEDTGTPRERLLALLDRDEEGEFHYLEHLGWQFVSAPAGSGIRVHAGTPGWRKDLQDARAAGDLRIRIAVDASDEDLRALASSLPRIARSTASRLAYNLRLADATVRATSKLQANTECGNYTFPQFLVVNSPWWRLEPPEPEWVEWKKNLWTPRTSPSRAIEALYHREAVAECYAGQLSAVWAAQYELYGPEHFDRAFSPEEIVLGAPVPVGQTAFGWCNDLDYALFFDKEAREHRDISEMLCELGPKAFVGVTGIIMDVEDRDFCNENLLIVDISARAVRELAREGGLKMIAFQTLNAKDHYVRTKYPFTLADEIAAREEAIRAIFDRPVFKETMVYIHPYGVIPLGEIAEKKLRKYQAAVWLRPYWCGREHAFYRRYHEYFLRAWRASHAAAPRTVARH